MKKIILSTLAALFFIVGGGSVFAGTPAFTLECNKDVAPQTYNMPPGSVFVEDCFAVTNKDIDRKIKVVLELSNSRNNLTPIDEAWLVPTEKEVIVEPGVTNLKDGEYYTLLRARMIAYGDDVDKPAGAGGVKSLAAIGIKVVINVDKTAPMPVIEGAQVEEVSLGTTTEDLSVVGKDGKGMEKEAGVSEKMSGFYGLIEKNLNVILLVIIVLLIIKIVLMGGEKGEKKKTSAISEIAKPKSKNVPKATAKTKAVVKAKPKSKNKK
jgi:hypothetical protein